MVVVSCIGRENRKRKKTSNLYTFMTQFDKLFCNQYTDIGAEWHNVQMCRFWYN
jgi:hypothetical protein